MNQYICFHVNYMGFVRGVKYKIKNVIDKYYIVENKKIPIRKNNLFYTGCVIKN